MEKKGGTVEHCQMCDNRRKHKTESVNVRTTVYVTEVTKLAEHNPCAEKLREPCALAIPPAATRQEDLNT